MDIQKVAILGAGALGGFYASQFFDAADFAPVLVARGERYDRLKADGLVINGRPYSIPVTHPDEATAPADLIMVALKHHHLADALGDLRNLVGDQTTIISVMNGLDSEKIIGAVYGMDKMLYTIAAALDAVRNGNQLTIATPGRILFGEATNAKVSPRVQRMQEAFDRAGIAHGTPVDMIRTIWWKFMVNVGMNQASVVMRAPYGVLQSSPEAQALMEALAREAITVAGKAGVSLVQKDLDDWFAFLQTLSPAGKTSMLQDIEAGRKTEVEIFGGKVVELGLLHNVPTPVNETVTRIIQVLEQRTV